MDDDLARAEHLRRSIGELVRATRRSADEMSPSMASTLGYLDRDGELTVAELARRRGIRHQSMRVTVEQLERRGLIERRPDPTDARSFEIRLSPAGKHALDAERHSRAAVLAAAIERAVSPAERADVDRACELVERITAAIGPS